MTALNIDCGLSVPRVVKLLTLRGWSGPIYAETGFYFFHLNDAYLCLCKDSRFCDCEPGMEVFVVENPPQAGIGL